METINLPFSTGSAIAATVSENTIALQSLLNGHWFVRRGTVADIVINADSVMYVTPASGSFTVSYRVSFFYACDGIELGQQEQSRIMFTIPDPGIQLVLHVEPEPERYDEL